MRNNPFNPFNKSDDVSHVLFEQSIFQTNTEGTPTYTNIKFNIKCIADNTGAMMCVNKQCRHPNVFRCMNQTCQCKFDHQRCNKRDADYVFKWIYDKLHKKCSYYNQIQNFIKKKNNQIQELKSFLYKEIQDKIKEDFLYQVQKKFTLIAKGQAKSSTFTSVDALSIWTLIESQISQKHNFSSVFSSLISKITDDISKSVNQLKRKVYHFLAAQKKYFQNNPEPFFFKSTTGNELAKIVAKSSAVLKQELSSSSQLLIKIFDKKITNMQCLYKASQHDFSLSKYFSTCGTEANTIILCKTHKNKIIGGYTPLRHDEQNNNNWGIDNKGQSFIFSLTDRQRFVLKNNNLAIHRYKEKKYIQFGSAELAICNKSNITNNCFSDVNHSAYFSPAYTVNDKAAYLKFNGNDTSNFTTLEWEAWKVTFAEEK